MNNASKTLVRMLQPYLEHLSSRRVILASNSAQRKEVLKNVGIPVEVVPSHFSEDLKKEDFSYPYEYAEETARRKVQEVAERLQNDEIRPYLIIGADTVVSLDGQIFEKPKKPEVAFDMLSSLSGKTHSVHTGVAVVLNSEHSNAKEPLLTSFHEETKVTMGQLEPEVICAYIETGEPLDKAGAYGIQKVGGTLVEAVHGDYFNVVGLPLHKLCKHLSELLKNDLKN